MKNINSLNMERKRGEFIGMKTKNHRLIATVIYNIVKGIFKNPKSCVFY